MSKEKNKVVPEEQPNTNLTASNIQEELLKLTEDLSNSTFLIGSKILDVQINKLYKEWGFGSFSNWLDKLSQEANVGKTTLWDYRKIVEMLKNTNTPFSEVSNANIKGLYQIARIHKKVNDHDQTKKLIEQLSNKEITVTKLKELAKEITKPSETKAPPEPIDNKKSPCKIKVYQRVFISLLPILIVVFYITDIS